MVEIRYFVEYCEQKNIHWLPVDHFLSDTETKLEKECEKFFRTHKLVLEIITRLHMIVNQLTIVN